MTEKVEPHLIPKPLSGPLERQREETVETLKAAFEKGVVNLDEYEERIALATTASTPAELAVLTRDVSIGRIVETTSNTDIARVPETQGALRAVFGSLKQAGEWTLGPQMEARAVFGEIHINLSQAQWVENQARIECKAVFGTIIIGVPEHVYVDCSGTGVFGEFVNDARSKGQSATHRLTVSGKAVFGSVKIVRSSSDHSEII